MKRKLLTLVFAASVSIVSFTGCKKDANAPAKGGSRKEQLVGSYKMTELSLTRVNPETQKEETIDILEENFQSCERDNLYVLKADMTTAVVDAGEQCDPSSNDTGTWSMPNDQTIVMDDQTYNIENINGNTLKMTVHIDQEGTQATLNLTYVKQ
jgi:hypothetical protein